MSLACSPRPARYPSRAAAFFVASAMLKALTTPTPTDNPTSAAVAPPACPRCDYDLAGQRQADELGRCPECGLEFAWADLRDLPPPPHWCLELRLGKGESPVSLAVAAVRSVAIAWTNPKRLWNGIVLRHPINPLRLVLATAAMLLISWLVYVGVSIMLAAAAYGLFAARNDAELANTGRLMHRTMALGPFARDVLPSVLIPGVPWTAPSSDSSRSVILSSYIVLVALIMPLAFLLLGTTMTRAKVRRVHLARGAAYGLVAAPLAFILSSINTWASLAFEILSSWLTHTSLARGGYIGRNLIELSAEASHACESVGPWIIFAVCLFATWSFWRRFSSSYMRLPFAVLDTTILLFVVLLIVPLTTIVILGLYRR